MVKVSGFLSLFENILKQIPQCDPTCYNPPYSTDFQVQILKKFGEKFD
jgi:hypothetical protein